MLTFYSDNQSAHAPLRELNNGDWMDFAESPARLKSILAKVAETALPRDHGMAPILAVHDAGYVDFLKNAHSEWLEQGREGDAIGYAFPVRGRRSLAHDRIDARLGQYGFDAASPISAGTWQSAYWAAQSALSALDAIIAGETRQAFALCRPPGHHSGRDYFGGYCYLNNAAIAARAAEVAGLGPVAILDVDYHHGNGTQDIFYEDGGVFFASIHADPKNDYPYFWGHADETGEGQGEGATCNQPLPRGTTWEAYGPALDRALERISAFGAKTLIVSYGADTFESDPISEFKLTTPDMQRIGAKIATLHLPTLTVMEGGYRIDALGSNVEAYLAGLEAG
ncbi:MAG: histone deacetylase family protein [Erythrobacter sp.]|nr:histone deacetylase family protein [Erythrobacter sp.]